MPASSGRDIQESLDSAVGTLLYAQVYMKVSEIIEGDFFNQYVKSGKKEHLSIHFND